MNVTISNVSAISANGDVIEFLPSDVLRLAEGDTVLATMDGDDVYVSAVDAETLSVSETDDEFDEFDGLRAHVTGSQIYVTGGGIEESDDISPQEAEEFVAGLEIFRSHYGRTYAISQSGIRELD